MSDAHPGPTRPSRLAKSPLPPIPEVDAANADAASVEYSHYRTGLSHHRTDLSEHRTDLSEFRTDLSSERTEMSMRRTGMSFQRTRLSADRTLMSVIRTSLSLIGFGFTIFQAFKKLYEANVLHHGVAPRNFGAILVILGMALLIAGIINHMKFSEELRRTRVEMTTGGLIHGESRFPVSTTLLVAFALLMLGAAAVLNIVFDISLFG